ncbi:MAG: hypothetical protein AAFX50_09775 [Acidobacteriota bacterium]
MTPARTWWWAAERHVDPIRVDVAGLPDYLTAYPSALTSTGFVHRAGLLPEDQVQVTARTLALDALLLSRELSA